MNAAENTSRNSAALSIAIAQMACEPGQVARNVDVMIAAITQAAAAGADLVVFPEMADTGYDMAAIHECASVWDGPGPLQRLSDAAQAHQVHVVAGLAERTEEGIYNTLAAIAPSGQLLARYRKVHLITAAPVFEHHHLLAGDRFITCQIAGFTVGLMTCYDVRFPEQARALTVAGAELIVIPAAFPLSRIPHWDALIPARAIENQVYIAACNRVGTDNTLAFGGHSQIVDPYGCALANAFTADTNLIHATLHRGRVDEVRSHLKCLEDRRPELYRSIAGRERFFVPAAGMFTD